MAYSAAAVSNTAIAFQKPITLQQGRALRDNPEAIREAIPGAPYIAQEWHPYNGVSVGDGNTGLFYDFAVHGVVASVETPNWADDYEYMVSCIGISGNGIGTGSVNFQVAVYPETSAAYTATVPITAFTNAAAAIVSRVTFYSPRLVQTAMAFDTETTSYAAAGIESGLRYQYLNANLTAQKHLKARFSFSGGVSIDAGQMFLYRRKSFVR